MYSYGFLNPFLPSDIEFIPLELPGRGRRFGEDLLRDKKAAVLDYVKQIRKRRNGQPFVVAGHSMGGFLGFEVALMLEDIEDAPNKLVVTGNAGPNIHRAYKRFDMEHEDFMQALKKIGGTPPEVLENEELLSMYVPILRADFEVVEKTYLAQSRKLKKVPIEAIMGTNEERADRIDNWQNHTELSFTGQLWSGNHFFIHHHARKIATTLTDAILQKAKIE